MKSKLIVVLGSVVGGLAIAGGLSFYVYQNFIKEPSAEEIGRAYNAKDWRRVNSLYSRRNENKLSGEDYARWAEAHIELEDFPNARMALMSADDANYQTTETRYMIAALYAREGNSDLAVAWLGDAIANGFTDKLRVDQDTDFDELRSGDQFRRLWLDESDGGFSQHLQVADLIGTWTYQTNLGLQRVAFEEGSTPNFVTFDFPVHSWITLTGSMLWDEAEQVWKMTAVDGFGRIFEGVAKESVELKFMGTVTYLDGTKVAMDRTFKNTLPTVMIIDQEYADLTREKPLGQNTTFILTKA